MKKPRWKVSPGADAAQRFNRIAERFEMSGPTLAAVVINELSYVRPESFFQALGAIPGDLKTRPVGRPAGSKNSQESAA